MAALAAWAGFTLPSAIAMTIVAYGAGALKGPAAEGLAARPELVAVAIVAQAVLGMARNLAPDRPRATIAVLALMLMAFAPAGASQIAAIAAGGALGLVLCRRGGAIQSDDGAEAAAPVTRRMGLVFLAAFFVLLAALLSTGARRNARTPRGVLSLRRAGVRRRPCRPAPTAGRGGRAGLRVPKRVSRRLRRGAGRAGAALHLRRLPRRGRERPAGRRGGAALALIAIFLPGLLVLMGALPFWHGLRARPAARAAMAGVNAAVVGLLASALYDPVWTSAVKSAADFAVAAAGFAALVVWRAPPLVVVVLTAAAGVFLSLF